MISNCWAAGLLDALHSQLQAFTKAREFEAAGAVDVVIEFVDKYSEDTAVLADVLGVLKQLAVDDKICTVRIEAYVHSCTCIAVFFRPLFRYVQQPDRNEPFRSCVPRVSPVLSVHDRRGSAQVS